MWECEFCGEGQDEQTPCAFIDDDYPACPICYERECQYQKYQDMAIPADEAEYRFFTR